MNAIHKAGYIYRDLKPENLLLSLDGHACITDFGLAKKVTKLTAIVFSICGTDEIMAPEIEKGRGYNCMVDYYNIGTLAFELATGQVPVFSWRENILLEADNPCMTPLSEQLKDFLKRLLEPKPSKRLGFKKGLNEICEHPWMKPLNISQLNCGKVKPPLVLDPNMTEFSSKKVIALDVGCETKQESLSLADVSFYDPAAEAETRSSELENDQGTDRDEIFKIDNQTLKFDDDDGDGYEIASETSESISTKLQNYKSKNIEAMKKF